MTYYILASRESGKWAVEFGDYDKAIVSDERAGLIEAGTRAKDLKIIKIGTDRQTAIDAAIATVNAAALA